MIFYRSLRIGQYGRPFYMWKFRTMIEKADKVGGPSTAGDDWRLTKIGKFLRKWQIDELPQLINILKGECSFIGWRPEVPEYLDTIPEEVLETKCGLTGLATLWDYNEGEKLSKVNDPDKYYEEEILPKKRELELYYVRNQSFVLDIKIIIQTLLKLCHSKRDILHIKQKRAERKQK